MEYNTAYITFLLAKKGDAKRNTKRVNFFLVLFRLSFTRFGKPIANLRGLNICIHAQDGLNWPSALVGRCNLCKTDADMQVLDLIYEQTRNE